MFPGYNVNGYIHTREAAIKVSETGPLLKIQTYNNESRTLARVCKNPHLQRAAKSHRQFHSHKHSNKLAARLFSALAEREKRASCCLPKIKQTARGSSGERVYPKKSAGLKEEIPWWNRVSLSPPYIKFPLMRSCPNGVGYHWRHKHTHLPHL